MSGKSTLLVVEHGISLHFFMSKEISLNNSSQHPQDIVTALIQAQLHKRSHWCFQQSYELSQVHRSREMEVLNDAEEGVEQCTVARLLCIPWLQQRPFCAYP